MKIRKIDRRVERDILIGLIVDKNYMAQVRNVIQPQLLKNSYARTVAVWCTEYYDQYKDVPFAKIQDIYEYHNRKSEVEEDQVDLIEKLLQTVNEDYTQKDSFNSQFLLDVTEEYFNRVRLETLVSRLQDELESGTVKKAEEFLTDSKSIKITTKRAVDTLVDREKINAAFDKSNTRVLALPGDFGLMLEEQLNRGSLVAIQGTSKGGKTWLMNYIKIAALIQRKRVLNIQLGDLTEEEALLRDSISLARKSNEERYCGTFKCPVRFIKHGGGSRECELLPPGWDVEYEKITIEKPLTAEEAYQTNLKFYERCKIEKDKYYRFAAFPGGSINVQDIDALCEQLYIEDDFVPDIILPDYMDILGKENPRDEGRDKINANWIAMKALAQRRKCLAFTPTQSDADAFDGKLQTKKNFSDDRRKLDHVNGAYGMNQTDQEKIAGINKFNVIVARSGDFVTSEPCYVLQCLRRGMPVIDSLMPSLRGQYQTGQQQRKVEEEASEKIRSRTRERKK